jgi:glycosyltransferase involved in cell wall biosynthesis
MKSVFLIGTRWFGVLGPCKLLIGELCSRGYVVYVFGQKDAHYEQFDHQKVTLVEINSKRSYFSFFSDFCDVIKIRHYIKKLSPDYIHSFNPKPSLLSYFSLIFNRKVIFNIGVTGLGNTFIKAKYLRGVIASVMRRAGLRANNIFFQNPDDMNLFRGLLKLPENKMRMFRSPGVDTDRFILPARDLAEEPIKVLLVARLLWQKGVDDFCDTYHRLKSMGLSDRYRFTLVGELDLDHPDRLTNADAENIANTGINWIKWTDRIEDIYATNDILLFMSKREGGPRAILEASAMCMPTIGSDCIGVKELIEDGVTGFLVQLGDVEKIVDYLELYRKDVGLIQLHGATARKEIAEKYSLKNATKAQLEMYEQK